jgi:hypothetical protein
MTTKPAYLRRYTSLPALLYMLHKKALTLLDPANWEDKNDSYYLSKYKERSKFTTVLAVCFTQSSERYHHWQLFAQGSSGVCVEFRREEFVKQLLARAGVLGRDVKYKDLATAKRTRLPVKNLPFVKRIGYEGEAEYRFVYRATARKMASLDVPFTLDAIKRITLNPWIPAALHEEVKRTIKGVDGCKELEIVRSTLISNNQWKELADKAEA